MTTTTKPHYFVLDKRSSSYTFHQSLPIEDVEVIPETVQQLITRHHKWDPRTSLEIKYYLVPVDSESHWLSVPLLTFPQADEFEGVQGPELEKQIEQTVNDRYLRYSCREIHLCDLGGDVQQNLIVIAVGRSAPALVVPCEC